MTLAEELYTVMKSFVAVALEFFVIPFLITAIYAWHCRATSWRVVPDGIPWFFGGSTETGARASWFAQIRAHLRDFSQGTNFVSQGYKRYSKVGRPFISPSFVTWQPEVVLPPSQVRWLVEQPESVLSIDRALKKDLEFDYTTPTAWSFTRPFHVEAINKLRLDNLVEDMSEEVQESIDREWGLDTTKWKDVNIEDTMRNVLVQITARVFVGPPLCNNKTYLQSAHDFIAALSLRAILISLSPELLRPLAGWYFSRPLKRLNAACAAHTVPLIEQAMSHRRTSDQATMPLPKTLLEQTARLALRSSDPKDSAPFSIASRLLALTFVAVHTSTHSLVNALVDVVSPPAGLHVFETLREEAEAVYTSCKGVWTKSAVAQLVKTDSALRESLRLSTFKAKGVERIVVAAQEVTLPDGTFLPPGAKVGVPVLAMHRDEDFYTAAGTFVPFRFAEGVKAAEGDVSGHVELINSSETFLAFGHGRHAW